MIIFTPTQASFLGSYLNWIQYYFNDKTIYPYTVCIIIVNNNKTFLFPQINNNNNTYSNLNNKIYNLTCIVIVLNSSYSFKSNFNYIPYI